MLQAKPLDVLIQTRFNSASCSEYIYCLVLICIEYLMGFSRQVRILSADNYKKFRMTPTHFIAFLLHVKHFIYFLRGKQECIFTCWQN